MTTTDPRTVTRSYRAAIRLGEDFITLEQTVVLPIDASDDEIELAVDTGWRIFQAQHEQAQHEIAKVRADTPVSSAAPEAASEPQRKLITTIATEDLGWSPEQLAEFAAEQGIDSFEEMTNSQASRLINSLKKLNKEQRSAAKPDRPARSEQRGPNARQAEAEGGIKITNPDAPASERQINRIVEELAKRSDTAVAALAPAATKAVGRKLDLRKLRTPEGAKAARLTKGEASALIGAIIKHDASTAHAA